MNRESRVLRRVALVRGIENAPPSHDPTSLRLFLILVITLVLIIALVSLSHPMEPMETLTSDPSGLQVNVSVNSTIVEAGHSFTVDIWETNNFWMNNVSTAAHWAVSLVVYPCVRGWPLGVGLLPGHYVAANLTEKGDWVPYPLGWHCPANTTRLYYLFFSPQSSKATVKTDAGTQTWDVRQTITFTQMTYTFSAGQYTVVAGDEWGHLAFAYFDVGH